VHEERVLWWLPMPFALHHGRTYAWIACRRESSCHCAPPVDVPAASPTSGTGTTTTVDARQTGLGRAPMRAPRMNDVVDARSGFRVRAPMRRAGATRRTRRFCLCDVRYTERRADSYRIDARHRTQYTVRTEYRLQCTQFSGSE
jgi:hypothetical protein